MKSSQNDRHKLMYLYIKQKVFSMGDKFFVTDANGDTRYSVMGEVFSFGKKLHIFDRSENEVAYIQQKVFSFLPRYYVTVKGTQVAEVVKEFTLFRNEYTVKGTGWTVHGNFIDHSYQIYDSGKPIAEVQKRWLSWGDTYEINIDDSADELLALCVCLVIDACLEAQRNSD